MEAAWQDDCNECIFEEVHWISKKRQQFYSVRWKGKTFLYFIVASPRGKVKRIFWYTFVHFIKICGNHVDCLADVIDVTDVSDDDGDDDDDDDDC